MLQANTPKRYAWSDKGDAGGAVRPVGVAGARPAGVDHVRGRRPSPRPRRRDARRQRDAVVDQLVQAQQISGTVRLLNDQSSSSVFA